MMPETARYTALVEKNVEQAVRDMQRVLAVSLSQIAEVDEETLSPISPKPYPLLSREFLRRHGRDLFACAAAWFLVDVVFYSSNLFQSKIYSHYLPKHSMNAFQEAFHVAKLQAIIAVCSTIPGYYAAVYLIDRAGRVKIQLTGFFFMALGLLAIGIPYKSYWHNTTNMGFMVLYSLTFFFANLGPNTTTFIVPAELFPARFRATCHGISGAAGKVGAVAGSVGFLWGSRRGVGMTAALVILGGICVVGMAVTYLVTPETRGRSLEENECENDDMNGNVSTVS
ncbi:putative inorganic phosphate transporter 1-9 [Salvia divinorum]|uniref:Inorganic phosphate transporter 1-9 n=1 Tax=Salvia divinorum TaxID=28513 RepID=A0ABD1G939_SALDI